MTNIIDISGNHKKKKTLASLMAGVSDYDNRLWKLLSEFEDTNIAGYDHAKFFPYFAICGASIIQVDYDSASIRIQIDEENEERFYSDLEYHFLAPLRKKL